MKRDAATMHVPFPADPEYLHSRLMKLVEANDARNATLRVAIVRNKGGVFQTPNIDRDFDVVAFTTGLAEWGEGVKLMYVENGRFAAARDRGTKVLSWSGNLYWYEEAHNRGFDEVILLNERGEVSECTSANLFATFGSEVYTPPLESGCLPGVTRATLLEDIRVPGIRVSEKTLMPKDLEEADEVFISSTTRNLLPVLEIEGKRLNRKGDVRARLNTAFEQFIDEYVCARV
jgi:branched-chain amino acid aminotransferase